MTVKLIYSIISLILIIGSPVCFYLYNRFKKNIRFKFWDIIAGIVLEFVFKYILVNLFINLSSNINIINNLITTTTWGYACIDIVLTVILLLLGLFASKKIYYKNEMGLTAIVSLTLGMNIADLLNSTLAASLSNIVYIKQTMDGTFLDNLLVSLTNEQAQSVIDSYNALPNQYFLYIGIISFAMLISDYLTVAIFCHENMKSHKYAQIILLILIMLIYTTIYYFTSPTTSNIANPLLLIFAGMQLIFAQINVAYMIAIKNKKK